MSEEDEKEKQSFEQINKTFSEMLVVTAEAGKAIGSSLKMVDQWKKLEEENKEESLMKLNITTRKGAYTIVSDLSLFAILTGLNSQEYRFVKIGNGIFDKYEIVSITEEEE